MPKRILLFLVLFFTFIFAGISSVNADDDVPAGTKVMSWGPEYTILQRNAYNRAIQKDGCATPSLECLVHQTSRFIAIEWVNDILYPSGPPMLSPTPISDNSGVPANPNQTNTALSSRGAIGGMFYLMGEMYRYPAAKTSVYVADILENAHIITPAYAQGLGFSSLNPVLELWKVFRNVAYMIFVFIIVVIGFMIMFRQKISGQSVVTAQQAIPSVIASLIFVTFSYAIAGFLIDLMYLSMFMMIGIFGATAPQLNGSIIDFNIAELMGELFNANKFETNVDIVSNFLDSFQNNESITSLGGLIGGITMSLVLAVAILIGTFKLFFELLKSYANVILSVVTAPLVLLGGAFPGKNAFTPWIKNIIGNLSAFPTVLMVIILFYQFTNTSVGGASTTGGFLPPFLVGRGQAGAITSLMGLAIILALPEIVKEVKKKLGATEGFGTMIANAAGARAKQGWDGSATKGWGAKKLLGGGTFVGASAATGGIGALAGGIMSKKSGGRFRDGLGKGALIGAAAPTGVKLAGPLLKSAVSTGKKEVGQYITTESIGGVGRKIEAREGRLGQIGQKLMAEYELRKEKVARGSGDDEDKTVKQSRGGGGGGRAGR